MDRSIHSPEPPRESFLPPELDLTEISMQRLNTLKTAAVHEKFITRSDDDHRIHRSPQSTTSILDRLWALEIVAVILSITCLTGIGYILFRYNNHPLSAWTFYSSLNAVISALATASRVLLIFAVAGCISQGKWNRFKARPGSLDMLQTIDSASRGGVGSLRAVKSYSHTGLLLALGASVSVGSLLFDTLIQSLVSNYGDLRNIPYLSASVGVTTYISGGTETTNTEGMYIGADGNSYFGVSDLYADNGLQIAISSGFTTSQRANTSTQLNWSCPTGNCTWEANPISLAVCSKCFDVSNLLTSHTSALRNGTPDAYHRSQPSNIQAATPSNRLITNYTLGYSNLYINNWSGFRNGSNEVYWNEYMVAKAEEHPALTANFKDYESLLTSFVMIKANSSYMNNQTKWEDARPSAMECGLYLCLQAYNTTVTSGRFMERVVATSHHKVPESWMVEGAGAEDPNQTTLGTINWNPINTNGYVPRYDFQLDASQLNISLSSDVATTSFNATQTLLDSTVWYLTGLLAQITGSDEERSDQSAAVYDKGSTGLVYTTPTLQSLYESTDLNQSFASVAKSMTSYFRNIGNKTEGEVQTWTIHYHVRWGFIVFPAVVVLGGALFVFLTVVQTCRLGTAAWKHSITATMLFSIDAETRKELRHILLSPSSKKKIDEIGNVTLHMHDYYDGIELSSKSLTATSVDVGIVDGEESVEDEGGDVRARKTVSGHRYESISIH